MDDGKSEGLTRAVEGRSSCQTALQLRGESASNVCVVRSPSGHVCYALDYAGGQSMSCPAGTAANDIVSEADPLE